MSRSFDDLVAEAEAVSVEGWDFSWLSGRASEQRPSWGYARMLAARLAGAQAALDVETGGGEVLGTVAQLPALMVATESWPPNVEAATRRLHPRGVAVVAHPDGTPLPFGTQAFDLVVSRHPVVTHWDEIARVLRPGGAYFSQQVGPGSVGELNESFLGPQPAGTSSREPRLAEAAATDAGLTVVV